MRLWSLDPGYLDAKGLVACWREGLLAKNVLLGETRGYRDHPQLERFKASRSPVVFIDTYLHGLLIEANKRGYKFDRSKLGPRFTTSKLNVSDGQLAFEFAHLKSKLAVRDTNRLESIRSITQPDSHPLFEVVGGNIESWERI